MSQVNRNLAYLTEIDAYTPWERLRVIRNFLEDREQALALAQLGLEEAEQTLDKDSFEYKKHQITLPQMLGNIADCEREIGFLKDLEGKLKELTEPTRIEGKTDEEMYELNYPAEFAEKMLLEAQADFVSTGRVNSATLKSLIRNPQAMQRVVNAGILTPTMNRIEHNNPLLEEHKNDQTLITYCG